MRIGPDYASLDEADRAVLLDWFAQASNIDAVVDMSLRPWNVNGARAVVGVFEAKQDRASWILVCSQREWALARCHDGLVSDVTGSLSGLLALIEAERPAE